MKTVDFMDEYQVRRVRDMIASETTKIRFVDLPGSVDTDEKRNNRPCLMRTVYRFLLGNSFLIEYVYTEYEHTQNYMLVPHRFYIVDVEKISSKTNWLIDNNAIYNAVIGSWDNLNSQDKNVYELGATAIIKYANYVAQSLANIKRYESDIKNGKSEFDCDFPKEQKPRFKNDIINRPTFLINLPAQLALICH